MENYMFLTDTDFQGQNVLRIRSYTNVHSYIVHLSGHQSQYSLLFFPVRRLELLIADIIIGPCVAKVFKTTVVLECYGKAFMLWFERHMP